MSELINELVNALGKAQVLTGTDIPEKYKSDWFKTSVHTPVAVVRPGTPEEVAAVMRICSKHQQSVTPQGGLTGLVGGAAPREQDLVLSLERLSGIEELDTAAATMTVRAGTPLQTVQDAAREAGFLFAVDLGARGSCQIGGNIATNAGGNRVLRYGMMREQVLGLEVVLANGSITGGLNKMLKNNAGYDLKHLFIGSEGTLGIVTRAVLRLHSLPSSSCTAWCALPNYEAVVAFLRHAQSQLGGILSAYEVMWPDFYDLVTQRVPDIRAPLQRGSALHVLIEAEGSDQQRDMERFSVMLESALEHGWVEDASIAQSLKERDAFWRVRDAVSEFPLMWSPYCGYDVSLPIGQIGEFVERLQTQLRARFPKCEHVHFGHIGDSNLHVGVHLAEKCGPFPEPEIDACVYELLREYRGSVSAEHGIGTHKMAFLGHSRVPEELALMTTVKNALDPFGLLNPGKVLP
ncbi:FAD-binding oxidoreductase [Polaromonas sp. P1(28)-13]|nr:FAD-binding oxidoreductase [Polaromonas sp. P1(28)-13]